MQIRLHKRATQSLAVLAISFLVVTGLAPSAAQAAAPSAADSGAQVDIAADGPSHTWAWWRNPAEINNGGIAETYESGENLIVEDFYPDGWGTRAQLQLLSQDASGTAVWINVGGVCFDDTSTGTGPGGRTVCDREVAEGRTMRVHVWASRSGTYKWHSYSPSIKA